METPMIADKTVTSLVVEDGIAIITVDSPPVNALSARVRAGIAEDMRKASADPQVKAIVLICGGRTFIAGADISEFGKPPQDPSLHEMIDTLESAPKPVIAAIHGTALGGGLETALGAHYRVAVPSAKVGLPEVKLGLIPGAGGTQRLPRIVGVERALDMITSGEFVAAAKAAEAGLIDEIVEEGKLREGAVAFARKVVAEGRPLRKVRDLSETMEAARGKPEIFAAFRKAHARKFRGFEAPEGCIQAIEAAVNLPFDEGMKKEREIFSRLIAGHAIEGPALRLLRRARGAQGAGPARGHEDASRRERRHHRRRHDGRRHRHELSECRHPGHDRRAEAGRARSRPLDHAPELRGDGRQGADEA